MTMDRLLAELFSGASRLGIRGKFQFIFSPELAFNVSVLDNEVVTPGLCRDHDVLVRLSTATMSAIASGTKNIEQLFANGELHLEGDIGLATRLPEIVALKHGANGATATQGQRRYPAPPRHSEVISSQQEVLREVSRASIESLHQKDFQEHYVANGIPVVITGALDDWPLYRMSPAAAAKHFDRFSGISRHGDYVRQAFSPTRDFRTTSIGQFVRHLDSAASRRPTDGLPEYLANNALPEALQAVIRYPALFPRDYYRAPRFWLGPSGTITPLHRDGSDNLFAQVWGTKVFILAPPHSRSKLSTWSTTPTGGLDGCDFDPLQPNFEAHPLASSVKLVKLTVQSGDLLFLPEGWFHHVRATSTSLSVNFWLNSKRVAARKLVDNDQQAAHAQPRAGFEQPFRRT